MQRFIIHYVTVWGMLKGATIMAPNVTRAIQIYHTKTNGYRIISVNKG